MRTKKGIVPCRTRILNALRAHPRGLNAARIRQIVIKDHPVDTHTVAAELVRLAREGKIVNTGKCDCPSCALRSVVYRIEIPKQGELHV